jgi:putative methionine-R-sulfoxide reductase with GAF domain
MHGFAQPDDKFSAVDAEGAVVRATPSSGADGIGGPSQGQPKDHPEGHFGNRSNGKQMLEDAELDSALQLLVERAQYITGATGTALALPQGDEMVCRASAGSSAPLIGARLQVRSGLTGESIARRQLLRCDNAEADPRVNLETCRALGIASIVVLPLLRRNGEVRGLFELFSDHPYAFEERDLIALERMAALTLTALDLAEQPQNSLPAPAARRDPDKPDGISDHTSDHALDVTSDLTKSVVPPVAVISIHAPIDVAMHSPSDPVEAAPAVVRAESALPEARFTEVRPADVRPAEASPVERPPSEVPSSETPLGSTSAVSSPAVVPEAMLRVQKCATCGFPVSEGRTYCLDCERKDSEAKQRDKDRSHDQRQNQHQADKQSDPRKIEQQEIQHTESVRDPVISPAVTPAPEEFVPAFLANAKPVNESWFANPVNLLAIAVLVVGILVAIVVFR